ncbi:MAG: phosphoserine phosphatase SerB, partial [Shimia sp.]|nr:phosphoserine phosphatase SerB [Shimia sp.]
MFVATLLTSPANPTLDPALVENLRNAWGGGDAQWLAPGEAAEFALSEMPSN